MATFCPEFFVHCFVESFDLVLARLERKLRHTDVGEGWDGGILM